MKKKKDMHPADIVAAIKKRNTSLAELSRSAGLSSGTLGNALKRPWPKGEFIIAAALGTHPCEIWPSRYYDRRGHLLPREQLLRRTQSSKAQSNSDDVETSLKPHKDKETLSE